MPSETPELSKGREAQPGRAASAELRRSESRSESRRSESRPAGEPETYSRDDQSEHDDEDAESDGAEGNELGDDEFSRQQAIYATQQRNMGYVFF